MALGASALPSTSGLHREALEHEAADGDRGEELPLGLLDALVEEALEEVAEELVVGAGAGEADVLPHLQDLQEDFGVLLGRGARCGRRGRRSRCW